MNPATARRNSPEPPIQVLVAAMLSTQPDLAVAGVAANGAAAVEAARTLSPDVVLMDLAMPGHDGVKAIRRIREQMPATAVIVLTAFDSGERILAAVQAGAQGYLLKGASRGQAAPCSSRSLQRGFSFRCAKYHPR